MKVLASHAVRDTDDLRSLIRHLGITQTDEVWLLVHRFFPGVEIPPRSRALVQDVLETLNGLARHR